MIGRRRHLAESLPAKAGSPGVADGALLPNYGDSSVGAVIVRRLHQCVAVLMTPQLQSLLK